MKLFFLGTGAADWDWTHFTEETRGSTSTLVNRHLLIDAGTSARQNFQRAGISPECIHDILITHSHSDHFSPESICSLAAESCKKPHLYASAQALQQIPDGLYSKHPLSIGEKLRIGTCEITVLRANHALKDPSEPAFHFLFDTPGKRMLYALDGAWMCSDACRMLAGRVIDLIVWDATCGNTFDDWRFADHNDLAMIRSMQNSMQKLGIIAPGTIHLFDHIARSLWPEQKQERFQLAEQFSGMLAFDGMELSLE